MPQTKKHLFKSRDINLAELAKALAHPARIAILRKLSGKKECICGEIVDVLPLAQATVSQHLLALRSVGLISGEVDGPKSCYCINWKKISELEEEIEGLLGTLKENQKNCC